MRYKKLSEVIDHSERPQKYVTKNLQFLEHNFILNIQYPCLTLTRPIGLPPHAPVAQKVAEQCTLIASLVKRLFARVDWTERLRDDSSTTD